VPTTSSLLGPNILLNSLFSITQPTFFPQCQRPTAAQKKRKPTTIVNQVNLIKIQSLLPTKYRDRNLPIFNLFD